VRPGRSGPWRSLLSVHVGCISDQMTGEMGPTYPHKNQHLGGGGIITYILFSLLFFYFYSAILVPFCS